MALALLDGRISVDRDLAQIVSACTTCGLCDVSCKFIMAAERQDVIIALKEHIAESGFGAAPKLENQSPLPTLGRWIETQNPARISSQMCCSLSGAGANHNPQHAATARKLAELLQRARVDLWHSRQMSLRAASKPTGQVSARFLKNRPGRVVDRLDNSRGEDHCHVMRRRPGHAALQISAQLAARPKQRCCMPVSFSCRSYKKAGCG